MKILGVMQNQWFKNPEQVRGLYARRPDKRNYFIRTFLFMGCLSGRRLEKTLGEKLCREIIWEEASPEIGGFAASSFRADPEHIKKAVETHQPELIICFGKISGEAVKKLNLQLPVLYAPHPAARTNPLPELKLLPEKIAEIERRIIKDIGTSLQG